LQQEYRENSPLFAHELTYAAFLLLSLPAALQRLYHASHQHQSDAPAGRSPLAIQHGDTITMSNSGIFDKSYRWGPYQFVDVTGRVISSDKGPGLSGLFNNDYAFKQDIGFTMIDSQGKLHLQGKLSTRRLRDPNRLRVNDSRIAPYGDHCEARLTGDDGTVLWKIDLRRNVYDGTYTMNLMPSADGRRQYQVRLFSSDPEVIEPMRSADLLQGDAAVGRIELYHSKVPLTLSRDLPAADRRELTAIAFLIWRWRDFQYELVDTLSGKQELDLHENGSPSAPAAANYPFNQEKTMSQRVYCIAQFEPKPGKLEALFRSCRRWSPIPCARMAACSTASPAISLAPLPRVKATHWSSTRSGPIWRCLKSTARNPISRASSSSSVSARTGLVAKWNVCVYSDELAE